MSSISDVLVIGGGAVGMTLARHLRGAGLSVGLIERHECGREASWAGAGILAPCNPHRSDPLFQLHERSLALFPDLCRELQEETGIDPEYERCGELELVFTSAALESVRADERAGAGRLFVDGQPRVELHAPSRVRELEPAVTHELLGGLECRQTAQVRNPRFLAALRQSCDLRGVKIIEHIAVSELFLESGRVGGVVTSSSETMRGGAVVLCAGAWSGTIGQTLPTRIKVYPVRGQMILLKLEERPFRRIIARGRTYLVPRQDGHVLIGSTEEPEAGFEKRNTPQGVSRLMELAVKFVPSLTYAPVMAMWSGLRPGTPDNKPLIGPVPGLPGLFAATGHFRSGLTNAPATAEAMAAMLDSRAYVIDLSVCAPGR